MGVRILPGDADALCINASAFMRARVRDMIISSIISRACVGNTCMLCTSIPPPLDTLIRGYTRVPWYLRVWYRVAYHGMYPGTSAYACDAQ